MTYRDSELPTTLNQALSARTVDELKAIAGLLSTDAKPTRKAELVAFIEQQFEGRKLQALWQKLDRLQQAAVAEVVYAPEPVFQANRFIAKYGQPPNWGERSRWGHSYSKLSLLQVFFFNGAMPEDLRARLRAFVPKPAAITLKTMESLPETFALERHTWEPGARTSKQIIEELPLERRDMESAALHDLPAVLHLVDAGKIAVSDKTQLPGTAAVKAISALLLAGDFYDDAALAASHQDYYDTVGPIRAFAWPLLLQAGGLAGLTGKRLQLSNNGRKALSAPPQDTLRTLWNRWLKTTLLDELRRVDNIKGQTGKGKRSLTAVAGRRAAIAEALRDCPPGHWIAVDQFFRYMQAVDFGLQVARDTWHLYINDPNYGSLGYDGYHDWRILEARYALCLLFEYAATLGLIDVAYIPPHGARPDYGDLWGTDDLDFLSRYDGLQYFRITPLGAYCLGLSQDYTPSVPKQRALLRILPNLEIVASGAALSSTDIFLLDSYTKRKSDAVWQLNQDKLLAVLEEGKKVSALRELLETRSSDALPETVDRFLQDMEERSTRLQDLGAARLIKCTDPALVALITNDSRTKKFCLAAGKHHIIVYHKAETRFRGALRKLGYTLPKS